MRDRGDSQGSARRSSGIGRTRARAAALCLAIAVGVSIATAAPAVAARLLTGADVADGSLTGADVRDSSLTALDLSPAARQFLIETPTEIRTSLRTVDGAGSGIDADLLDGRSSSSFQSRGTTTTCGAGAVVTAIAENGNVSCAADVSTPSGAAGGSLTGTYPNPTLAAGSVGTAQLAAVPTIKVGGVIDADDCDDMIASLGEHQLAFTTTTFSTGGFPGQDCGGGDVFNRLRAPVAGMYEVQAGLVWGSESDEQGVRSLGIKYQPPVGAQQDVTEERASASSTVPANIMHSIGSTLEMQAGGYVYAYAFQNSAEDRSILSADGRSFFSLRWVGPPVSP